MGMNVDLTSQLEELVRSKGASGLYNSASEVVREALGLVDEQGRLREAKLRQLRDDVRQGLASGPSQRWNAENVKREGRVRRVRKAARRSMVPGSASRISANEDGLLAGKRTSEATMPRALVLQQLAASKPELARRFGVTGLALFGSWVRGSARADSDVDVPVSFDGPATSARYFGVQFFLEDLLGNPVDLATDKALRPELRPYVEREAVHV